MVLVVVAVGGFVQIGDLYRKPSANVIIALCATYTTQTGQLNSCDMFRVSASSSRNTIQMWLLSVTDWKNFSRGTVTVKCTIAADTLWVTTKSKTEREQERC